MIQRLQTVFLAVATLLNLSAYFTPIYDKAMADPQQWIGYGLAISLLIPMAINILAIFLYENRKNQMSWVKRSGLMQVIALGFCAGVMLSMGGIGTYLWDEALGTGLVLLGLIFQILALRNIRKDEELVRSMDRIR
ncbi:DUF4293 family protein [Gracilimonas mengyeensis]|uniref:DUF4293 domain-containing protein n=1 Tax=Gracilimonas mengyeensis TaxID=1302730 RepID=A0A521EGE7_9BACT|nr:DUF4293 family protein [Gracilimonas mengyeensis]SMO82968.1 protein of unknown function [Gracilimonas mengyeensis]